MTALSIAAAVDDPSTHFQPFDDYALKAFQSVWRTRLLEATKIHHHTGLQDRAESILRFVDGVPASDLRLYIMPAQKMAFLYRVSTKASLLITDVAY